MMWIKDYETYAALVKELREKIALLKEQVSNQATATPSTPSQPAQPTIEMPQMGTATNFDILGNACRLKKEVFGKQILDSEEQ